MNSYIFNRYLHSQLKTVFFALWCAVGGVIRANYYLGKEILHYSLLKKGFFHIL